jgi:hypothetical protein
MIKSLSHVTFPIQTGCMITDGGDCSTKEEKVNEHDTESVMSSAQDHTAKETEVILSPA